jgi:ankyrin repeat protein
VPTATESRGNHGSPAAEPSGAVGRTRRLHPVVKGLLIAFLIVAVGFGTLGLAGWLIVRNLDLELSGPCTTVSDPLIDPAADGEVDAVLAELEAGTDPNRVDKSITALGCAVNPQRGTLLVGEPSVAAERNHEVVGVLLDHGADPNDGPVGPSPLLLAAWRDDRVLLDLLLDHGADPNHGGRIDSTVVRMAQSYGPGLKPREPSVPQRLLPEPTGDRVDNVPPLVGASWAGSPGVVRRLLDAGADPDLASDGRFTAMYAAAVLGDREVVELLLDHGADPEPEVDQSMRTPAHAAQIAGHEDVAGLLERATRGDQ